MIPTQMNRLSPYTRQVSLNAEHAVKFGNNDKPVADSKPAATPVPSRPSFFSQASGWLSTVTTLAQTGASTLLRQGGELLSAAGEKLASPPVSSAAVPAAAAPSPTPTTAPDTPREEQPAPPQLSSDANLRGPESDGAFTLFMPTRTSAPAAAVQTFGCPDIATLDASKQPKAQKWIDSLNQFLSDELSEEEMEHRAAAFAVRLSEAVECLNGIFNEETQGFEYGKKFTLVIPNDGLGLLEENLFEVGAAESFMLTNARLQFPDGSPVSFRDSVLADCGFITCDLNGVDFSNTTIGRQHNEVTFYGCDMEKAKFIGAQSGHSVDFRECKLNEADFSNAVLNKHTQFSKCDLSNAHFEGADLRDVVLNEDTILTGATYNTQTQFPEDFDPDAHGMRMV